MTASDLGHAFEVEVDGQAVAAHDGQTIAAALMVAGHEGTGISLVPVTGRLVADWITGSQLPAFAARLQPDRFELGQARLTLQEGAV